MAKWQASKSDMSPRKGYIPEIKKPIICYCPNGVWCDVEEHDDESHDNCNLSDCKECDGK